MSDLDKAIETQLKNIQTRTGRSLEQLHTLIRQSGLAKHGQIRDMLKKDLGMGHGDANTVTHLFLNPPEKAPTAADADYLDGIYSGPKANLRPIHDKLMAAVKEFGPFEIAPKKAYVSLRTKKQFAMIGPATNTRVEVGLNMKGVEGTPRLAVEPAGRMCQYKIKVTDVAEVDAELIGWIRTAYDGAK